MFITNKVLIWFESALPSGQLTCSEDKAEPKQSFNNQWREEAERVEMTPWKRKGLFSPSLDFSH